MAAGNGDIVEEDVCLRVAAHGGGLLVQEEARTRVGTTLDNKQALAGGQVVRTRHGVIGGGAGFHLL